MKKINETIKNNITKIIGVFLIISPFLDLLTSLGIHYNVNALTVGTILRGLFMLFMIYYSVFINKKNRKRNIIFLSLIFIYLILFLTQVALTDGSILYEIKVFFKTFYFLVLGVTISNIEKPVDIKYYIICFTTYLLLVFIPNILDIGFNSYEIAKVGQVGWFNSANEISVILSILTPLLIMYLSHNKNKVLISIYTIIILVTFFSIGTKVPILSLAIIGVIYIFYFIYKFIKEKNIKKLTVIACTIVLLTGTITIFLQKTSFYKNIEIHLNYLEVDNILDIFTDIELIDHFLLGSRLKLSNNNFNEFKTSNITNIFLGIGAEHRQSEMDFFDILINYGLIGSLIILTILIILIVTEKPKYKLNTFISLLLLFMISFLSGHVLVSPAVSIFIPLLLFDKNMVK